MKVPNWYKIAKKELGIREVRGGENPRIIEYHRTTTLKAREDEVPWCSSYVNWCMQQAGFIGTESAAAKSWLNWGASVWHEDVDPPRGSIVVMTRSGGGHVGFLVTVDWEREQVKVLGGNQGDEVNIKWFPMDMVLDFRMPRYTPVTYVEE